MAATTGNNQGICDLIRRMYDVFKTLRVLAFVGAGFIIAKYGWEFISTGKAGGKEGVEALKAVGIPLVIGFALLFGINVVLRVFMDGYAVDCADVFDNWR